MSRRVSHIIISIILLIATTGLTVSWHYCGESLKSIQTKSDPHACCDKTTQCCHDEIKTFRLNWEFESSEFKTDFSQIAVFIPRPIGLTEEELPVNLTSISFFEGPIPPNTQELLSNLQVYIL